MKYKTIVITRTCADGPALYRDIGKRLREMRARNGETAQQVADVLGRARTSVTNMELGNNAIMLHDLYTLALHWKVNISALLPKDTRR